MSEKIIDFDYRFYVNMYPDLRHLKENEALEHYKTYGKKEGRICKKPDFDYDLYTSFHPEMKRVTPNKAFEHYRQIGQHNGHIAKKTVINNTTHVTIILHLFHDNLFSEMNNYIHDVMNVFSNVNIIITTQMDITQYKKHEIKTHLPGCHIIKVNNVGVDVLPFLISVQYMRKHITKTDFVLKLHTKLTSNESEECNNWRKDLIIPITCYPNLSVIQNYFKKMDNIGYVSAQKCVFPKQYDLDFPQNIKGVEELCDKFPHLEKEWTDFNAGNMFWISNKVLDQYLTNEMVNYMTPLFSSGKPLSNLTDKSIQIEYICERLFTGVFCYDKQNIAVNEYNPIQRGTSVTEGTIDNKYFYQPRIISINTPKNVIT